MQTLIAHIERRPLAWSVTSVISLVLVSQIGAVVLANIVQSIEQLHFAIALKYLLGVAILVFASKPKLHTQGFINMPTQEMAPHWRKASLPFFSVVIANLVNVSWPSLSLTVETSIQWLLDSLAAGVFEEAMMRGLVFSLLLHKWGTSRNGLLRAAWVQAAIFGGLHLLNLLNGFSIAVIAQVIYATLIGFGFAGLVAYCKSIWPAVFIHALINAAGSMNRYFNPDYISSANDLGTYAFLIALIGLTFVVPGMWCLRKADFCKGEA